MFNIHVEHTIKRPINEVFAILTDHENYSQFKACDESSLLLQGKDEKNGDGALRLIRLGKIQFEERIFDFKAPYQFQYQITSSRPFKVKHFLGELRFFEVHGGTHVIWRSKGEVPNLLYGWLIDYVINRNGPKGFMSILRQAEKADITSR